MSDFTYAPVGATRSGDLPAGYRHLFYRTRLGAGAETYRRAGEAVLSFAMHRATGARVRASGPAAAPGILVTLRMGPLRAPCAVVWAVAQERQTGFGYGTRAGHPAAGEESFLVERDAQDRVWFTVRAYSRPAGLLMRLGGPAAVLLQHGYARRCGQVLKRLGTVNP